MRRMQWLALAGSAVAVLLRGAALEADFGVPAELWTESDATSNSSSVALLDGKVPDSRKIFPIHFPTPTRQGQRSVQILGLYNTGTNLLQALLDKNFPGVFVPPGPRRHAFGQIFWKHVQPTVLMRKSPGLRAQLEAHDTVALAMVRDPLAWLQSTKVAPYDLAGCVDGKTGTSWLTGACTLPLHSASGGGAAYTMPGPQTLPSLPAFWNEWTKDYERLQEFGFRQSLVIRYEDIVLDTEAVLEKIAQLVGVPPPESVRQKHGPAKDIGGGRAAAIAKLQSKSWLHGYKPEGLAAACARLDPTLMSSLDYHDCSQ